MLWMLRTACELQIENFDTKFSEEGAARLQAGPRFFASVWE